jgi:hypothetical protein
LRRGKRKFSFHTGLKPLFRCTWVFDLRYKHTINFLPI